METFRPDKIIETVIIENQKWIFRVADVYNPSQEEINHNRAHNDALGNFEPEKELPVNAHITITAESQSGETIELWWSPSDKVLGPHMSKKGWSKGIFTGLKGKLANWQLAN